VGAREGRRGEQSMVWQIVYQGVEMPADGEEEEARVDASQGPGCKGEAGCT
jgi:hypothetical protein